LKYMGLMYQCFLNCVYFACNLFMILNKHAWPKTPEWKKHERDTGIMVQGENYRCQISRLPVKTIFSPLCLWFPLFQTEP
jgi:hypothetical protein